MRKDPNIKIRNVNKICSHSMLKYSYLAKGFLINNHNKINSQDFQEEQINNFVFSNQHTMHNIYDLEFINNLLDKENKLRPDQNYLGNHPNLINEHRAILVDWLIEICEDLGFKRDTLHFAVNYLDRFLSKTENIEKNIMQLIGISCLSIAGKFEVL